MLSKKKAAHLPNHSKKEASSKVGKRYWFLCIRLRWEDGQESTFWNKLQPLVTFMLRVRYKKFILRWTFFVQKKRRMMTNLTFNTREVKKCLCMLCLRKNTKISLRQVRLASFFAIPQIFLTLVYTVSIHVSKKASRHTPKCRHAIPFTHT